jgi:aspartyl-tRNA(Asn)/glutamyl-tRNA(Gln) amidotransferase subunit C
MAKISIEQVRHVADLARLELSEDELEMLAGELSPVLDHVEQIRQLDTAGVPVTAHPLAMTNVLRDDVVREGLSAEDALAGAPSVEDGRFSVPSILGEAP